MSAQNLWTRQERQYNDRSHSHTVVVSAHSMIESCELLRAQGSIVQLADFINLRIGTVLVPRPRPACQVQPGVAPHNMLADGPQKSTQHRCGCLVLLVKIAIKRLRIDWLCCGGHRSVGCLHQRWSAVSDRSGTWLPDRRHWASAFAIWVIRDVAVVVLLLLNARRWRSRQRTIASDLKNKESLGCLVIIS